MKQNLKLAVIVPTFNRLNHTRSIIQQLHQQVYSNFQIIICDSGSTDGTQNLNKEFPEIVLLNVGSDIWWTGAINEGVSYAKKLKTELLLIINDDLLIPINLTERLLEYNQLYPETLITSVQLELSGLIYAGSKFNGSFKQRENNRKLPIEIENIDCSNGCCVLIPMKVFYNIGLIDEKKFPHVGGDLNIYLKSRKYGYNCIVVPDILIKHTSYTDYSNKFPIKTILSHPGSAMHFKTYLYNGKALYNSWLNFIFLGIKSHFKYIKTLVKILFEHAARKV